MSIKSYFRALLGAHLESKSAWVSTQAMPRSAGSIDLTGLIPTGTGEISYMPPEDGYISLAVDATGGIRGNNGIGLEQGLTGAASGTHSISLPVRKGVSVTISSYDVGTVWWAYFLRLVGGGGKALAGALRRAMLCISLTSVNFWLPSEAAIRVCRNPTLSGLTSSFQLASPETKEHGQATQLQQTDFALSRSRTILRFLSVSKIWISSAAAAQLLACGLLATSLAKKARLLIGIPLTLQARPPRRTFVSTPTSGRSLILGGIA